MPALKFKRSKLIGHGGAKKVTNRDAKSFMVKLSLPSVTCLDMSFPSEPQHGWTKKDNLVAACIPRLLSKVMQNIREVDFSYNDMAQSALSNVAKDCQKSRKDHLQGRNLYFFCD
jgi:hypothetical protein